MYTKFFLGVKLESLLTRRTPARLAERERERESEERRSDHHGLQLARRDSEGQGPQEKPEAAIHSEKAVGCQASCVKCDDNGECVCAFTCPCNVIIGRALWSA